MNAPAGSGSIARIVVDFQPSTTDDVSDVYPAIRLHREMSDQFAIKVVPGSLQNGGAGHVVEGIKPHERIILILLLGVETTGDDAILGSYAADGKASTISKKWFDRGSSRNGHAHKQRDLAALLNPAGDMPGSQIIGCRRHEELALGK